MREAGLRKEKYFSFQSFVIKGFQGFIGNTEVVTQTTWFMFGNMGHVSVRVSLNSITI